MLILSWPSKATHFSRFYENLKDCNFINIFQICLILKYFTIHLYLEYIDHTQNMHYLVLSYSFLFHFDHYLLLLKVFFFKKFIT